MIGLVLLAGGKGRRMGLSKPKQFLDLGGKPLFEHSLDLFLQCERIGEIVVVCEQSYRFSSDAVRFADPGSTRLESAKAGVAALCDQCEWVVLHDAARPFVSPDELDQVIDAMQAHGAATVATPVRYSVKEVSADGFVCSTIDRAVVWEVQTPQAMRREWLLEGFAKGWEVTDEATLIERLGYPVKVVTGASRNLKVTTLEDLLLARQMAQQ